MPIIYVMSEVALLSAKSETAALRDVSQSIRWAAIFVR